jgi:hypothetical protein
VEQQDLADKKDIIVVIADGQLAEAALAEMDMVVQMVVMVVHCQAF